MYDIKLSCNASCCECAHAAAKEFYASELAPKNADFGRENGEFLGGSPDSMGARMDSSDDCSIM